MTTHDLFVTAAPSFRPDEVCTQPGLPGQSACATCAAPCSDDPADPMTDEEMAYWDDLLPDGTTSAEAMEAYVGPTRDAVQAAYDTAHEKHSEEIARWLARGGHDGSKLLGYPGEWVDRDWTTHAREEPNP